MKTLETARDIGRKYGVSLHMLFQSVGQMAEAWGREGTRAWLLAVLCALWAPSARYRRAFDLDGLIREQAVSFRTTCATWC
jgi:type IV secretory pathway TraG/TraD family ATPase VirD4